MGAKNAQSATFHSLGCVMQVGKCALQRYSNKGSAVGLGLWAGLLLMVLAGCDNRGDIPPYISCDTAQDCPAQHVCGHCFDFPEGACVPVEHAAKIAETCDDFWFPPFPPPSISWTPEEPVRFPPSDAEPNPSTDEEPDFVSTPLPSVEPNPSSDEDPSEVIGRGIVTGSILGKATTRPLQPDEVELIFVENTVPWGYRRSGESQVLLGSDDREYAFRPRYEGDVAIVATGGSFNLETEEFIPQTMGVARGVFYDAEGPGQHRDIYLSAHLNQSLPVRLQTAGMTPEMDERLDHYETLVWMDFGFDGVLLTWAKPADNTQSDLLIEHLAPLEGPFGDVEYHVQAGVWGAGDNRNVSSVQRRFGITQLEQTVLLEPLVGVARDVFPVANGSLDAPYVEFMPLGEQAPSVWHVRVISTQSLDVLWDFTTPGFEPWLAIPQFPEELQSLLPIAPGELVWIDIRGLDLGPDFSYDDYSRQEFGSHTQLRGWSNVSYLVNWNVPASDAQN